MKYAVTGANGMIGKFLVEKLAKDGHEIVAICRSSIPQEYMAFENVRCERGDVTDIDFLRRVFFGVDGVFHVAAFAKPWVKDKSIYYHINETGTENVCKASLDNGVKRVVYTSSAGTHGAQQGDQLISEEIWPNRYDTDYELSKFNGRKPPCHSPNKTWKWWW
ncbi:MAG: NAD-dependent epimerase/dehydratase family protein [Flavobacteriales bacterium]